MDYLTAEPTTPKIHSEFKTELRQVLNERNMLTARTKKRVIETLDEMEEIDDQRSRLRKKENAIFEILVSEKNYINQLTTVIEFFMKPIEKQKLLDDRDFEKLFGSLQTIHNINRSFLEELYKGSVNVVKAFLSFSPYFKLYSVYAMNFEDALNLLQSARVQYPELYKFIDKQETRPEVQQKLSALLIAPIQRIPRYKLLLEQLLELTLLNDLNFNNIQECVENIAEVALHINKVLRTQEDVRRLLEVQRFFYNGEPAIIKAGRELIKEGILSTFTRKMTGSEKYYVILLTDIIIFGKMKKSQLKTNSVKCDLIFPLHKCSIIESEEKGCFQVECVKESIVLYHSQLCETKEWITIIREGIFNCLENRKTLKKENSERRPVKRKDIIEYHDVGLSPGMPLRKRKRIFEEEISKPSFALTKRRPIKNPPRMFSDQDTSKPSEFHKENEQNLMKKESTSQDVFVFGQEHQNNNIFRFTKIISGVGTKIRNIFGFGK